MAKLGLVWANPVKEFGKRVLEVKKRTIPSIWGVAVNPHNELPTKTGATLCFPKKTKIGGVLKNEPR